MKILFFYVNGYWEMYHRSFPFFFRTFYIATERGEFIELEREIYLKNNFERGGVRPVEARQFPVSFFLFFFLLFSFSFFQFFFVFFGGYVSTY